MYVYIHSGKPTHRQKYICTCTEIADTQPLSDFHPVHAARSPYSLQVTSQVAFALYSCQSPTAPPGKSFLLSIECAQEAVPTPYIHNSSIPKEKISRPEFFLPVPLGMIYCSQTPKQLLELGTRKKQ